MDNMQKLREYIRKVIREINVTGGGVAGATYIPGEGMQTAPPVAGKAKNYYVKKLGFKLVPKGRPKSKAMDYKDLWK
jgi:hypothetical protein